jgi:hypothetical protein
MKLSEYIKTLQEIITKCPELGEMEAVYSIDDEGNAFHSVHCTGTPGNFRASNWEFTSEEEWLEYPEEYEGRELKVNAVCIN